MGHLHEVYDYVGAVVMGSSLLYSFLPNWDQFNDYPKFQSAYKFLMIFIVKFASFNFRSQLKPEIQATANVAGTPTK